MRLFPPHCTHRLQPLDRSIYGPFKKYFNTAADEWDLNNPSKRMTIYDLPGYVNDHNLLLPAGGEAGTTSNKNLENLLKYQLFGNDDSQENNKIANRTAADIEQQLSTSSDAAVNLSKQRSEALSSP